MASSIFGVSRVAVLTSLGSTLDSAGTSRTSSNVSPSLANFGGCAVAPAGEGAARGLHGESVVATGLASRRWSTPTSIPTASPSTASADGASSRPTSARARGRAAAARPRLAGVQAHLLAGDRAAGRGRLRGDRPRPAGLRRQRGRAGRVPRRRRPQSRPPRAGHRGPRPRAGRAVRRRPRRPGGAGPRPPVPRASPTACACSTRRCPTTRSAWRAWPPGRRWRPRLLPPPGHRRRRAGRRAHHARAAPALHRHLLHVPLLVPPGRLHRRPARSTSTPSRSATPPTCGRPSAPTRACSTRPRSASRPCSRATRPSGR